MKVEELHAKVGYRLSGRAQRYTEVRRSIVERLSRSGRPLTVPEILSSAKSVPLSSAYRNLTVLLEAGVVRRVAGTDDQGRFELAEDIAGHHHHLVCEGCGTVDDVPSSTRLESVMDEAARLAAEEQGYDVWSHRFDLIGLCRQCQG